MIWVYIVSNAHLLLQGIASEVQSESKWKQLGELAMSTGKVFLSIKWIFIFCDFFNIWPNYISKYIHVQIYFMSVLMYCWIWPCLRGFRDFNKCQTMESPNTPKLAKYWCSTFILHHTNGEQFSNVNQSVFPFSTLSSEINLLPIKIKLFKYNYYNWILSVW